MRLTSVSLAALLALATMLPAQAAPEPHGVTVAFGNTVKAQYSDGKFQRLWFKSDGSWEAVGRRGKFSAGQWSLKDGRVCLRQSRPFPAPFNYCTMFPASGGIGAVWTSRDWQGEPIKLTVVRGIEKP
jgi:hypothetical protein